MNHSEKQNNRIDKMQKRSQHCVCKYCGSELEIRSIVFNEIVAARIELYCTHCGRIEFGVEKEIYRNAKYFIEVIGYSCFPDLDDTESTRQMSVAKVCEIMSWNVKNLGLLNEEGFCVPIKTEECMIGECLLLTDQDLTNIEQG